MTIHQSCQLNKKHPRSLTGKAPEKSCLENYLIGKVTFQMLNFRSQLKNMLVKLDHFSKDRDEPKKIFETTHLPLEPQVPYEK